MTRPSGSSQATPPVLPPLRRFSFGRTVHMEPGEFVWVYLWELPLRATHWLSAFAILTLVITGFYIGRPYFMPAGEASANFLMGKIRLVHFVAAGFLVFAAILRIYWLFAGNQFERWEALLPHSSKDWTLLVRQLKAYLLIRPEHVPHFLGHNPLQKLSYTALYAVGLLMICTGFAMYGDSDPNGFFHAMFTSWLGPLFGGIQRVRFIHHVGTWVFIIFLPVHVYLAMRMDILEETGVISSIVSGGRWLRKGVHWVDAPRELQP
jgi:Ni/Fe-hydrogenase b-type cytochrome subunit